MKWEKRALEQLPLDIIDGDRGENYPKANEFHNNEYCLFLNTGNVTQSGFEFSTCQFITVEKDEKLRKGKLIRGDVVLTTRGTLGNAGLYSQNISYENIRINSGMVILRSRNTEELDPQFIYYSVRESNFQTQIANARSGSAQPQLPIGTLKTLDFHVPPLPTQRKIAGILSAYDDLIENNLKRIKLLEEKALLNYKELTKDLFSSKKVEQKYISDCLSFYIGGGWGQDDYEEGFSEPAYVIRGTDLQDVKKGNINSVPYRYHKESNLASRRLLPGDIVFEVSGGSKGQPVGRGVLITSKLLDQFQSPVMCASFCKLLRANDYVTPELLYLYLTTSYEDGTISRYEKHSASNIVNYGFEEFISEQKILVPDEKEMVSFSLKVKPIFTLMATLGSKNNHLIEARDILLPKLMSGQIEV